MRATAFVIAVPVTVVLALVTGCAERASPTASTTPACASASATGIALAVGADTAVDPAADSGCVAFPANSTGDTTEYLLVAQSAGGAPGDSAAYELRSTSVAAGAAPVRLAVAALLASRGPVSRGFGRFLHELARTHGAGLRPPVRPAPAARAAMGGRIVAAVVPPALNSLRQFTVCGSLTCGTFKTVTARVRAVGAHVAIYVDTLAPAGGLDSAAIDSLAATFDTHVYDVDTAAFGSVSDIDSNGVVLTVMTPVVNSLVTAAECERGGYVSGFFFPLDLDPLTSSQYNHGEIFYTVVADPTGSLSCAHSVADVETTLPGTFLHELQHIIGFNQHVLLRGGTVEDLWLDEALSSFGEELGGQSYLPNEARYSQFVVPLLYNASQYYASPQSYFLFQTGDTVLAEFGAGWLFVRYLVDQYGSSLTNRLEATTLTGTANVAAQTGVPFATTATNWALANWVSDLPGFTAPADLKYTSWAFRATFASLHQQDPTDFPSNFPLVPLAVAGSQLNVAGYLRGGSPTYFLALQAPGAGAYTLQFSGAGGGVPASTVVPRLVVLRIR